MHVLLEFWQQQKNHGNPYYEPTIVVHDTKSLRQVFHNSLYIFKKQSILFQIICTFLRNNQYLLKDQKCC